MTLLIKRHIDELNNAGDYCIAEGSQRRMVIMACPVCAGVFVCPHEIINEYPLTLSPSVVGPAEAFTIPRDINIHEQIRAQPCGHHFWVKDGEVIDAM